MKKLIIKIYNFLIHKFGDWGLEKIYPVRIVYYFLRKKLISNYTIVHGRKMYLDANDSLDLSINHIYEETETNLVRKEIKKGDVVLDIGANIGYYTLIFADLVGKEGQVYAFEPDSINYEILVKNIEVNGFKNITPVNKAVTNKLGKIPFYINKRNTGDNRIMDFENSAKKIEVEAVSLDDYFSEYRGKIDFIKMDIQGSEGLALEGMKKLIEKNKNIKVISEFWPGEMTKYKINHRDFLNFFESNNFKFYEISEEKKSVIEVKTKVLLEKLNEKNGKYANLFFKKQSH